MGLHVISRYGSARYALSSSTFMSASPPLRREGLKPSDDGSDDSLTPQRKHHKLLKDGSEVWSKEVEKIFVEGLRKYWESPWATYSRGRSRWRNQFLVDHLKSHGIERTKKQVASHIQVLRNMWRGEPEFHLVAGGEELFQENGLLASSQTGPSPGPSEHSLPRSDRSESFSSPESTPDYSAAGFLLDLPPLLGNPPSRLPTVLQGDGMDTSEYSGSPRQGFGASVQHTLPTLRPDRNPVKLEPLTMDPQLFTLSPHSPLMDIRPHTFLDGQTTPPNRICSISLWSGDTMPYIIDVDKLISSSNTTESTSWLAPSRILLRIKINLPMHSHIGNTHAQPGFHGAVTFATPWTTTAHCLTKVWSGNTCIAKEPGVFKPVSNAQEPGASQAVWPSQMVVAYLPDSTLSRCQWLETNQKISQQIIVDNEVLAVIMYYIERTAGSTGAPSVELMGFQKHPWRGSSLPSQQLGSPPLSPTSPPMGYAGPASPQSPPYSRAANSGDDPSLSCALSFNRGAAMYAANPPAMYRAGLY